MKAIFSVYVISPVTGHRVFYHSYSRKSYAVNKALKLGERCVVAKRIPFGESLEEYEVI